MLFVFDNSSNDFTNEHIYYREYKDSYEYLNGKYEVKYSNEPYNTHTIQTGINNVEVPKSGKWLIEYPISSTERMTELVDISIDSYILIGKKMPSFLTSTDEELAIAMSDHYCGLLDMGDFIKIGDQRSIHIDKTMCLVSDNSGYYWGNDHNFVVLDTNYNNLYQNITKNGKTSSKAKFTIGLTLSDTLRTSDVPSECLVNCGNQSGADYNWSTLPAAKYLDYALKNSFPKYINMIFRKCINKSSVRNGGTTTYNYLWIPSLREMAAGGSTTYETDTYAYYKTAANLKYPILPTDTSSNDNQYYLQSRSGGGGSYNYNGYAIYRYYSSYYYSYGMTSSSCDPRTGYRWMLIFAI